MNHRDWLIALDERVAKLEAGQVVPVVLPEPASVEPAPAKLTLVKKIKKLVKKIKKLVKKK